MNKTTKVYIISDGKKMSLVRIFYFSVIHSGDTVVLGSLLLYFVYISYFLLLL